ITVDGQPVFCADTSPVDSVVATAEDDLAALEDTATATAGSVAATAEYDAAGWEDIATVCPRVESSGDTTTVYIADNAGHAPDFLGCAGYKVTVEGAPGSTTQHVHVPQVCLTTTNTCVGPANQDVTAPTVPGTATVCVVPAFWWHSDS